MTRRDRIRNDWIRGTVEMVEASAKGQERKLQWLRRGKETDGDGGAGKAHKGETQTALEGQTEGGP